MKAHTDIEINGRTYRKGASDFPWYVHVIPFLY